MYRFERVSCCQKMGFRTRNTWIRADLKNLGAGPPKPGALKPVVGIWVSTHKPEDYVYENYARCLDSIVSGKEFKNT